MSESKAQQPAEEAKSAQERQQTAEEDNPHVRRYNMYPQKAFGGHIETKVLPDGRIKYTIFPFPYDGSDKRTLIVDPTNPEEMRAVKQVHLIHDIKNDPRVGVYIFENEVESLRSSLEDSLASGDLDHSKEVDLRRMLRLIATELRSEKDPRRYSVLLKVFRFWKLYYMRHFEKRFEEDVPLPIVK